MTAKRTGDEGRPYVPVIPLHDANSGERVGVSGMWVTTFEQTDRGTVIKFLSGEMVTVAERFEDVMASWQRVSEGR